MPLNPMNVTTCTCAGLRKATRLLSQNYDAALKPSGLKATQFTLLATVEKTGTLPLSQLASVLGMERTTLTRNLKHMVDKGFLRSDNDSDQRVRLVSLTKAGEIALYDAVPLWEVAQTKAVNILGKDNWAALMQAIEDISSNKG